MDFVWEIESIFFHLKIFVKYNELILGVLIQ
jgi:hypothetical protein